MSVLAEHVTSVTIESNPPITLPVSRQTVTLDREWVPYVQASITCPLGDGAIEAIDPTADALIWATVSVRRMLGRTDRLSDLTRMLRGQSIGEYFAPFDTNADVTGSLYHDYAEPGHPLRFQARDFRAIVREAPIDYLAAEVRITLGGGESRLMEDVNVGPTFTPPGADRRGRIDWVLARNGFPPVVNDYIVIELGPPFVAEDQLVWETGETAWEYIQKQFAIGGVQDRTQIWCTETGEWWVGADRPAANNGSAAPKTTRHLWSYGDDRSVVNAVEQRSREDGFNAVVLKYRDGDGAMTYDIATTPGAPVRAYIEEREGRAASRPGAAARMLARAGDRGRGLEVLAVSDYDHTPGDRAVLHTPGKTKTGDVMAVQWSHPEDEMSVRLRKVTVS